MAQPSPSLPFPPSFSPFLPYFPLPPSPSLPLEVGPPQIQLGNLGIAVSSPSGVWDGTPAEIELVHFSPYDIWSF